MYSHVVEQLRTMTGDSKVLYEEDWTNYSKTTGYKISKDAEWVDSFGETVAAQVSGLNSLDVAQQTFQTNS